MVTGATSASTTGALPEGTTVVTGTLSDALAPPENRPPSSVAVHVTVHWPAAGADQTRLPETDAPLATDASAVALPPGSVPPETSMRRETTAPSGSCAAHAMVARLPATHG